MILTEGGKFKLENINDIQIFGKQYIPNKKLHPIGKMHVDKKVEMENLFLLVRL